MTPHHFFKKQIICPACKSHFEQSSLITKHMKIAKRDTDFFNFYEGEVPYLYQIPAKSPSL